MPRLLKRPEAEHDLNEIWFYIAQDSPDNADRFLDRIQETCLLLANFPHMGVSRAAIKESVWSHAVGRYLIFYFPINDGVDIIRIIHGARDIDVLFEDEGS